MKVRLLAAVALVVAASPVLAQGLDSKHSPYPASAYSGYVRNAAGSLPEASEAHYRAAPAYQYSGQHAGGPAGVLR
ncbi:hypothetical protein PQI07_31735 [Methylobacterium sp. 092160098-2]|uniref:hypothetical protein n=1 Tax=Methylobacterium sp. 092160098-2 TaxID=3025129 RepID=UPI002381C097|nr:hypothetical protein [Methylobacterium sp. 092160098-2]MDE4915182.1 hypothetical protein [Methylobacterium sp. 092160098-2]